jgi:hypothetical protein
MPEARIKAGIWVSMALRMGNASGRSWWCCAGATG